MARVRNKQPRSITLPPIRCERTKETMAGITLAPWDNIVPDAYIANALGPKYLAELLGEDIPDDSEIDESVYVIRGERNGHKGIKNQFHPRYGALELFDDDKPERLAPLLSEMTAEEAISEIKRTKSKPIVMDYWEQNDPRKTVVAEIQSQAKELGCYHLIDPDFKPEGEDD